MAETYEQQRQADADATFAGVVFADPIGRLLTTDRAVRYRLVRDKESGVLGAAWISDDSKASGFAVHPTAGEAGAARLFLWRDAYGRGFAPAIVYADLVRVFGTSLGTIEVDDEAAVGSLDDLRRIVTAA